jgi:hypothetical protein
VSQNHLTLAFPLKSPADAKVLGGILPPMMPELFKAEDAIGTVHYSRFAVLSDKTFLFLADFDGEFGQLTRDLASHAGPVFDTIFAHVDSPPPSPVANNAEAFAEWAADHLLHPSNVYSAYPGVTVQGDQGSGCRRGRRGRHSATAVPGDPAHQIASRLHRDSTAPQGDDP